MANEGKTKQAGAERPTLAFVLEQVGRLSYKDLRGLRQELPELVRKARIEDPDVVLPVADSKVLEVSKEGTIEDIAIRLGLSSVTWVAARLRRLGFEKVDGIWTKVVSDERFLEAAKSGPEAFAALGRSHEECRHRLKRLDPGISKFELLREVRDRERS